MAPEPGTHPPRGQPSVALFSILYPLPTPMPPPLVA